MDSSIQSERKGGVPVLLASLFFIGGIGEIHGAPSVAATQPKNGDQRVSPDLTEIVITFDQDMDPDGYSFLGGGPTFPKVTGKPRWRTRRECVLPVQLEPGQAYSIGLNSDTKTNFRSSGDGTPATPAMLGFKTGSAGGTAPTTPLATSGEAMAESVKQLRDAIEHRYSYRDVHQIDWAAAWKSHESKLLAAASPRQFAVTAGEMLAATRDPHIWLMEGGEVVPAFRRMAVPNADLNQLPKRIPEWSQPHPALATGKLSLDIGYLAIHSWDRKHQPQLLEGALAALDRSIDLPGLVIDVRFNSGGDEMVARQFAGAFVEKASLYARHVNLDASSATGFSEPVERWIEPTPGRRAYAGRVAVLMGPANMSSAEAFLLMMKQVPGCQLVGERSYGSSGNPQPHPLANGVTVYLPSWKAMLPDGTVLETRGITPDVEVVATAEDFAGRDPVIDRAVEALGKP